MNKRQKLGQHLLKDSSILNNIVKASNIASGDTIFEIGTGEGDLTEKLCSSASKVISIEIDKHLFEKAKQRLKKYGNLELIQGDGFKINRSFDLLISNIPYSKSRKFIEWLAYQKFKCSVVTVQTEFAEKILAKPGLDNYKAISVLAQNLFQIQKLFEVRKEDFYPPPKVDSTAISLRPKREENVRPQTVSALKTLFSFRGRLVSSALKNIFKNDMKQFKRLAEIFGSTITQKRVEQLTSDEAFWIANMLAEISYEK